MIDKVKFTSSGTDLNEITFAVIDEPFMIQLY